jgi:hypothetical protein
VGEQISATAQSAAVADASVAAATPLPSSDASDSATSVDADAEPRQRKVQIADNLATAESPSSESRFSRRSRSLSSPVAHDVTRKAVASPVRPDATTPSASPSASSDSNGWSSINDAGGWINGSISNAAKLDDSLSGYASSVSRLDEPDDEVPELDVEEVDDDEVEDDVDDDEVDDDDEATVTVPMFDHCPHFRALDEESMVIEEVYSMLQLGESMVGPID